jgi:hypothetical protein
MGSAHQNGHLWWHSVSRRQFLGAAAAATGALAAGLRIPSVLADNDKLATVFPLPIPGGITVKFLSPPPELDIFVHHFPPTVTNDGLPISEPSQITDFNGVVGVTRVIGSGVDSSGSPLSYQVDNGFMSGLYRGEDGRMHHGTSAFI